MAVPLSPSYFRQPRYLGSPLPSSPNYAFDTAFLFNLKKVHLANKLIQYRRRKRFRCQMRSSAIDSDEIGASAAGRDIWRESDVVEVIGIGSRVDSVLDFCLNSQSPKQSVRYWNVAKRDSSPLLLQEKTLGKDGAVNIVEASINQESCSKAVVLVAGAGYGEDHIAIVDILKQIKSTGGLTVAVILKPFNFEGIKRQEEAKFLLRKLQDCTDFCLEIDIDTLLKMDLVTLDEALRTTNRAVFSAIHSVSVLISDIHRKLFDTPVGSSKRLAGAELVKVLDGYAAGQIGFGAARNVNESIRLAVYESPFLSVGLKDLDGLVICIVSSASSTDYENLHEILSMFRQITEYSQKIILSVVHDPSLQPGVIATTVIIVCSPVQKSPPRSSILSRFADNIPSVFNFLRRYNLNIGNAAQSASVESSTVSKVETSQDNNGMSKVKKKAPQDTKSQSAELQMLLNGDSDKINCDKDEADKPRWLDVDEGPSVLYEQNFEGCQREPLEGWNSEPGVRINPQRIEDRTILSGYGAMANTPSSFALPIGVRPSDDLKDHYPIRTTRKPVPVPKIKDGVRSQLISVPITTLGSESTNVRKKHLSVRAASMLETERDSTRKWSRMMEIGYKGGIYKGYCQGGLPEGRGRLRFPDGSVYDGMWHYGKRSGLGTFNFSNGDVFQGSWRDDLMHGKGWFYFHSGDRWFANFWKGRANGEGRFYSKSGDIFFGHFRDGWRHGHFLSVKADGTRYAESWNEGVCESCEQLDSESGTC